MPEKEIFKGSVAVAEASRDTQKYSGFLASIFAARPNFNLFAMFRDLPKMSDTGKNFLEKLTGVLTDKVAPDAIDAKQEIPDAVIAALAEIGAMGIKIPKEYGGLGLTQSEYHEIAIPLGSWCASVTVLVSAHNSIGVPGPLKQFGTKEQKEKFLPRLAGGELSGFALTEPHFGCDISEVKTYARRIWKDGDIVGYELTGEKLYITNSVKNDSEFLASLLIVIAQIVDNPSDIEKPKKDRVYGAFIVETSSLGCVVKKQLRFMGVRGIYNGHIGFENVFIPQENRLRAKSKADQGNENDGLYIALSILTVGRLTLPAACLGALKQCLRFSRIWGHQRVQWGKRIGEWTLNGEKIITMACRIVALEAMVKITGIWVDAGKDVRLESAAIKVLASEWLLQAALDLRQIRGGRGFETVASLMSRKNELAIPAERMLRDAPINTTWEGTSEIMRVWMARENFDEFIKTGIALTKGSLGKKIIMTGRYIFLALCAFNPIPSTAIHLLKSKSVKNSLNFFYIEYASRILTFLAGCITAYYQKKLETQQIKVSRMVNVSMNLFAMAAALWYTSLPEISKEYNAQRYARHFCKKARKENRLFSLILQTLFVGIDTKTYHLTKPILDEKARWLEKGTIETPLV